MPYDNPYNRMIARNSQAINYAYADRNAYSNQLFNSRGQFSNMNEIIPKPLYLGGMRPDPRISNYHGGITNRNMEGSAAPLGRLFHDIALGEDLKRGRGFSPMHFGSRHVEDISNHGLYDEEGLVSDGSSDEEEEKKEGKGYSAGCMSCGHEHHSGSDGSESSCSDEEEMDGGARCCFNSAMCNGQPRFKKGERPKAKSKKSTKGDADKRRKANRPAAVVEDVEECERGAGMSAGASTEFPEPYMKSTGERYEGATLGAGLSAGAKRKPSVWIMYVKHWAKQHKIPYHLALKDPQLKADYHAQKKMKGGFAFLAPLAMSLAAPLLKKGISYVASKIKGKKKAAPVTAAAPVAAAPEGAGLVGHLAKSAALIPYNLGKMAVKGIANYVKNKPAAKAPTMADRFEASKGVVVKKRTKKGGSVMGGPVNDPVNKGKITGLGKTGSALYNVKGQVPLDDKAGVPPTEDAVINADEITDYTPTEAQAGAGKRKRGRPSKTPTASGIAKMCMPKAEAIAEHEQLVDVLSSGDKPNHIALMVKEKKKQAAELKKLKGGMLKTLMPGSMMSGGRKPSAWIQHVKAYAKTHNIKYGEALKLAQATYKK